MTQVREEGRAWVDEEDAIIDQALPAFLKQSHVTPHWALPDVERATQDKLDENNVNSDQLHSTAAAARKRFRNADLDALLSRTEPLLLSKRINNCADAPVVLSVLPLPRDAARTIQWHRNGQIVVVGGNHHLYTFHAAGRYVELLTKIDVEERIEQTCLTTTGEEVLVVGHECVIPKMLSLMTEKLTPLQFLDTRDTAIHRTGRRDNSRKDFFITKIAVRPDDALGRMVAVASGNTVKLGSLASGSVISDIALDNPVSDLCFPSAHEIAIAAGHTVSIYDIRKTARFIEEFKDEGLLAITSLAWSSQFIVMGSNSGMVNLYNKGNRAASSNSSLPSVATAPQRFMPLKTFKNLTTPIHALCFGENSNGDSVLAFSTKSQKAGFRLARLPSCQVLPSFPLTSLRHGFVQSLAISTSLPILSVGERQKVTNYAM